MEYNTLVTLPIEVHYKYVQYIDLRDLAALMFSCKEFYELFGTDLQLQKIVYEHTEQRVLHNKLRRPIKHLFMENRANYALKIDDIDFLKYTLPSLSYKDIALRLLPFSSAPKTVLVTKASKKSVTDTYLQKIFDYDAAKCFDFLLESFAADVVAQKKTEKEQEEDIYNVMLLVAIACFKRLQLLGSVLKLPHQKTIRVFLSHCQKWKELILAKLVKILEIERPMYGDTIVSKMVLESLMACSKEFPEFHIDLGMRIPSRLLNLDGTEAYNYSVDTLLEYAAATKHSFYVNSSPETGTFNYLMKLGAPFDPNAPYVPLALKSEPLSPLSLYLEKLVLVNINALLKPANETLLNSMLNQRWHRPSAIEYLLYRGAKLTKEEEARWLNTDPNSPQYKVAKCQQIENYSPLKTIGEIPEITGGYLRFFSSPPSREINLFPGRKFEDYNTMSSGVWEVKDGKLILEDTHKKINFGSYDEDTVIEGGAPPIRTYSIVKTCLGLCVAIAPDDPNSNLTEDEKVRELMYATFYQVDIE